MTATKIVLTGGPGAGKTAILELARKNFGTKVEVLHEAASIVFSGGFPRRESVEARGAAQRAIYHVQVELETIARAHSEAATILCDRGTLDGLAYWPGNADDFWKQVHSSYALELARYDAVIHLRTPSARNGYHRDALRIESAKLAEHIDERLLEIWKSHPRRYLVESTHDFMTKARETLAILESEGLRPSSRLNV